MHEAKQFEAVAGTAAVAIEPTAAAEVVESETVPAAARRARPMFVAEEFLGNPEPLEHVRPVDGAVDCLSVEPHDRDTRGGTLGFIAADAGLWPEFLR